MLRSMPIFNIFCAACYNTFKDCAALPFCSLSAGCRLPPAVYMYFLHSFSFLLSAVCRLLLVLCCHLPVSFYGMLSFLLSAVYCLLASESCLLSAFCFLLSPSKFAQRVRKFFSEFYKTCYMCSVDPDRRKCCVCRMLVADKHDCVEQKMKSRSSLREVGTSPANFTQSSPTLQLVLRAHPQRDVLKCN
jgi:hypothetical protein